MKIIYLQGILLIPIMLMLLHCVTEKERSDTEIDSKNEKTAFSIVDSFLIEFNDGLLYLTDYSDPNYLTFDLPSGTIVIADTSGSIINKFNQSGKGPNEYGMIRGTSFVGKDRIVVASTYRYYYFSINGKQLGYGSYPDGYFFNPVIGIFDAKNRLDEEDGITFLLSGSKDKVFEPQDILNADLVSVFKPDQKLFKSGIRLTDPIYREKVFPAEKIPLITFDADNSRRLQVVFPYEEKRFEYDLKDLTLVAEYPTDPEHFTPLETLGLTKGDKLLGNSKYFQLPYVNTSYFYIRSLPGNITLLAYRTPVKRELNDLSRDGSMGVDMDAFRSRDEYIQVFKSGKKIGADIKVPSEYYLNHIFTMNHLVLTRKYRNKDENKYYRGKIEVAGL